MSHKKTVKELPDLKILAETWNILIFEGCIPLDKVDFYWSRGMNCTAGKTFFYHHSYHCTVHLNSDLLSTDLMIDETLVHELCHVAVFLVDKDYYETSHGPKWSAWASFAKTRQPHMNLTPFHNYKRVFNYHYICKETYEGRSFCPVVYGTQKKSSIIDKYTCAKCLSGLQEINIENIPEEMVSLHIKRAKRKQINTRSDWELSLDVPNIGKGLILSPSFLFFRGKENTYTAIRKFRRDLYITLNKYKTWDVFTKALFRNRKTIYYLLTPKLGEDTGGDILALSLFLYSFNSVGHVASKNGCTFIVPYVQERWEGLKDSKELLDANIPDDSLLLIIQDSR